LKGWSEKWWRRKQTDNWGGADFPLYTLFCKTSFVQEFKEIRQHFSNKVLRMGKPRPLSEIKDSRKISALVVSEERGERLCQKTS